ncbi:MAG: hypothetical protein ACP5PZ_12330 [Bacteroidales bacterium]
MKTKIKTIKKLLVRGDNRRIARLTGFTEQYVSRTLCGYYDEPHPLIIETAEKLIQARARKIEQQLTTIK